jgi:glycosyltransferase involved in cell wall biosynthesis
MKVSIVIAIYKDIEALKLIIDTLRYQTYKNFEVVIAEDGQDENIKMYINSITNLDIKHTTQKDQGVRKARSQNNGVLASTGDYLIFIDGDCLLYSTFIEGHVKLAQDGYALSGRRINLNANLTYKLKSNHINPYDIEKKLLSKYLYLAFNKETRFEQGISIKIDSFIYKKFIKRRDRNISILGCNFSSWRKDIVALNGFDENYGETAIPDDMDWDWRFKAYNIKIKSCKNIANMMHLHHKAHDRGDATAQLANMYSKMKQNLYVCKDGLNRH